MFDINPDELMTWSTNKLWNTVQAVLNDEDSKTDLKELDKIKYGFALKVPIWYITQEWYEIYPSTKKILILGHGKYKLDDFMDEKEQRDQLMRKIILDNLPEGVTEGRV